jgi:hypothetical protein
MKNFKLEVSKKGIETLWLTLSVEKADGTKAFKAIDLGGNATTAAQWGAMMVVKALNEITEETPAPEWQLLERDRGLGHRDYAIQTGDGVIECPSLAIAQQILRLHD